jgi:formimidoylglutamate deiminase
LALHSLRAASVEAGLRAIQHVENAEPDSPIHIHVAEQMAEVEECLEVHGARPVQFLIDQFPVNDRWCLIHATHLDDDELVSIKNAGAVVGLCPTTEANLGDGFFRADDFLQLGGNISIGSDSHCSVDLREELRLLEYGERLRQQSRAILGSNLTSIGRNLYCLAAEGGAKAIGINAGKIAVGKRADFTLVDPLHPTIGSVKGDRILDRLIFVNIGNPIAGVVVGGKQILNS